MSLQENLIDALVVTAEATGTELSKAALAVMVNDLRAYPEEEVLKALVRCRRELHGRLSLAGIIERIDDGFPGPEEAWAMVPKDEDRSAVVCQEIMSAVPFDLMNAGDLIASRMAFLETYRRAVGDARAKGGGPVWFGSWGRDAADRDRAILEAMDKGRIGPGRALTLLPAMSAALRLECEERLNLLADKRDQKRLGGSEH